MRFTVRKLSAVAMVACAHSAGVLALAPMSPMYFEHLTLEDGLSQNTVLKTLQDSQGFIWLATENGLNRYDGVAVKRYLRDPQTTGTLGDDYIWDLSEDSDGNLWIASNAGGLHQWVRQEDRFHLIELASVAGTSPTSITSVETAPNGQIWVGTLDHGLFVLTPQDGPFDQWSTPPKQLVLSSSTVKSIRFDERGVAFVGTDRALEVLNSSDFSVIQKLLESNEESDGDGAYIKFSVATDGNEVWVASQHLGLRRVSGLFDDSSNIQIDDFSTSLDGAPAHTALRDSKGNVWIGTHKGLLRFNRKKQAFERFRHDASDPSSLGSDYVVSLFEDDAGLLWVGTRGAGVSRWNPRTWSLGADTPDIRSGAGSNAFEPAGDGLTWIGTISAGLVLHDESTGAYTRFTRSNGFVELNDQRIMSLLQSADGDLWIGTWSGGLHRYNFDTRSLSTFQHAADDPNTLGANGIMSLHQSPDGVVWVGTFGGGMASIQPDTGAVQRFAYRDNDSASVPGRQVTAVEDGDAAGESLWIGTLQGGLARLDRQTGSIQRLENDPDGIGRSPIYALHRDAQDHLWIGTAGRGLVRLSGWPESPSYTAWSTPQGFSSNVIYGIQPDDTGNLWLSSNDGLMRFNPSAETVEVFHRSHGLHSDEFNFNAHARGPDGTLYFGGSGGYNAFQPTAVKRNLTPPKVALTSFELFNEPADTPVPYPVLSSIDLAHTDDVITFEFAALDYAAPENNQYSYRLDGFDRDWSGPTHRRRATYTNLDSGEYTFRVRASNGDGTWTGPDEELQIRVAVQPAPWASWWAYCLYLLLFGGVVYGYIRWRIRRAEAAARVRQLTFYDRTTGLPNRDLFEQRLGLAMRLAAAGRDELVVLCLRANALREIGEILGYQVPDSVMTQLASRVSQCLSAQQVAVGDTGLARISDEAFVILLQTDNATVTGMRIGQALNQAAEEPIPTAAHAITVETSVGIATYYDATLLVDDLINFALLAASEARQSGVGVAVYDDAMSDRARDRVALERELAAAIENNELELYVQPKYSGDDVLIGGEALLRWNHPSRGSIPPTEFVAIAEQGRLIGQLNRWVIDSACRIVADWHQAGLVPVTLAVNVSAQEYVSGHIVDLVTDGTDTHCIDPSLIEVEITESVLMRDLEPVERCLARLRERGHTVALDDFGTGYSSLKYLQRLPIDKVKIDRSFVSRTESHADQAAICRAIVVLADSLGMLTVAEGVERVEQRDILLAMGCDEFQGFLYSRAVPASEFAAWLKPASI